VPSARFAASLTGRLASVMSLSAIGRQPVKEQEKEKGQPANEVVDLGQRIGVLEDSYRVITGLEPGDHLCCFYETEEERWALLTPFLRQGLERGEKVVYIADACTAEDSLRYLRDEELEVEPYLARGQLVILSRTESYMREGVFDPEGMIALLRTETERALAEGYPALRVSGEMAWALQGLAGSERLIEYEAGLNEFFPGSKCLAMCHYDQRRLDPAVLLSVLRTHPLAVVGRAVYDNFYYIPPAELLSGDLPAAELRHWLANLAERKWAEEVLRASVRQWQNILDAINDAVCLLDLEGRFLQCNRAMRELLEKPSSEIIGRTCWELIHGTPEPIEGCPIVRMWETHQRETSVLPTGDRWLEVVVDPLLDETGALIGGVHIMADITERRRAEEALRESEERYRSLVEASPDAITLTDLDTNIIMANQQAALLHGFQSVEEMLVNVSNSSDLIAPEDRQRAIENAQKTLETGSVRNIEYTFLRKDGTTFPAELSASLIVDADEKPKAFTAVTRDITERKRAEEQLAHMATHDALTGLPNRLLFNDRLTVALAHAHRNQQRLAMMLLDLDHFKEINDALGHSVGDKLLQAVGNRLRGLLRKSDTVGRMGGDEFLLLLPDIARPQDAATIAQKILEAIRIPFEFDSHELHVTTSIGIALYPKDGEDPDTLMRNADVALYRAKDQGRDNYQRYTPAMNLRASQ